MRHVVEGELHAWLDGALDELGSRRALEVREHLRSCTECQERLAAEEASRARAIEVLALAAPEAVVAPPFEALVERAHVVNTEGEGSPPRISRTGRLGWAATVVIALGAGWMARELGLRPSVVSEAPSASQTVEPMGIAPVDASLGGPVQPGSLEREDMADLSRPLSLPAAPPLGAQVAIDTGAPADAIASSGQGAAEVSTVTLAELDLVPLSGEVPVESLRDGFGELPEVEPSVSPRLAADKLSEREEPRVRVAGSTASAVSGREVLLQDRGAAIGVSAVRGPSFGGDRARDAQGDVEVTTEADPEEGSGLIVADLPVLRVEWTEMSPGRPGLQVLQQLASGDTLEIRFVRSGGTAADRVDDPLAPVVNAPLRQGWSQVVRVHRDGWLVARARLGREELESLAAQAGVIGR